jgi:ABC-type polysaccharide/polyol phosphate export permease
MPDITHGAELVEINEPVTLPGGLAQMWRNLTEHRHLVVNFIRRDVRLRYRNSALGYFWSLFEPLLLAGVYYVLYVIIAGKPDPRYPLWIILGVMTWSFFSRALNDSITCITRNEGMIKQVYFPRELFAFTSVGSNLILTSLSVLVAIPMMVIYRIPPGLGLFMVPVGLCLAALLGLGAGLGMACANVVNRDVEFFARFLTRAGMFISPVMWTVAMAPKSRSPWLEYLLLNPMAVPITMVRSGVEGHGLGISAGFVAYSVAACVMSFVIGAMVFKRFESRVVKKL